VRESEFRAAPPSNESRDLTADFSDLAAELCRGTRLCFCFSSALVSIQSHGRDRSTARDGTSECDSQGEDGRSPLRFLTRMFHVCDLTQWKVPVVSHDSRLSGDSLRPLISNLHVPFWMYLYLAQHGQYPHRSDDSDASYKAHIPCHSCKRYLPKNLSPPATC
jgi:hypothetical protein